MVLEMPFLTFSNANIQFARKKLTKRFYTTAKALSITQRIEIINKKEFTKAALDENIKAFVMYMISFSFNLISIYLTQKIQIALLVI